MDIADSIWTVLIGVVILAVIFMLARPGSPAGKAITDVTGALAAMISVATQNFGGKNQ
jgi:hypothetical protein